MINVLSLFDGISVARQALKALNIPCNYYASEINKYALKITQKNFPNTRQLGDVKSLKFVLPTIKFDLLIGGSPCTDLSIAKANRQGLKGEQSSLFYEYVRILKETNPRYFVLENVASMSKESRAEITRLLGVTPIMIDAALVSAQQRKRLFWTNIPVVGLPENRYILLKDILDNNSKIKMKKEYKVALSRPIRVGQKGRGGQAERIYSINGKSVSLKANGGGGGAKTGLYDINGISRKLTPIECERLQNLPDNFTDGISNTQRYKCLGNAFNCEVIKFILSFMEVK